MSHFQEQARGDVLSKVTNDIDNFSQTLNQTLTQLLVSVLTVIGVIAMMFSISPLLAFIALCSIPHHGLHHGDRSEAVQGPVHGAVEDHR